MATSYDLNITQGSSYNIRLKTKDTAGIPLNLSGFHVSGYIRNKYSDKVHLLDLKPIIVSGHSAGADPNDPLKTDAIHSGLIDINLHPTGTAALPITQALYDIEIYSGDATHWPPSNIPENDPPTSFLAFKVLNGKVNVHPESTY
ncbi:hypothetical protein CL634_00485 [bacterium]|nr:hypothetical protein [bacterium]